MEITDIEIAPETDSDTADTDALEQVLYNSVYEYKYDHYFYH